ncbi:amidohydrolase/deacetylase family metallohydrolase [Kovacikia minuta CCNUW1]|uniref:amidohydrolase/deacetylase family metallohydrolase n=1 Tax=Kovacikia minuta TaxID=2931930 RepID=UPI001CC9C36A|nr:amidohydrolase/deacetylase family metallohydrolase [Kovacikia minuta]UBF24372.1 amidohydrolase/deacetylase family metallohydrolase [Kovacikia minuta CCNUW1]
MRTFDKKTLYKNAHIIDPAQGIDAIGALLVEGDTISAIGSSITVDRDTEIIDLKGYLLTPGWIDIHSHVFDTVGDFCLPADVVGVHSGITTVADAGTSGLLTFNAFRETVVKPSKTRVYALLDPSLLYIATSDFIAHRLGFATSPKNQDMERAAAVIEENRDIVVGFKVRPTLKSGASSSPVMDTALPLAEKYDLPIMVHLGRFPADEVLPTEVLLKLLRPGDIITHAYQPRHGLYDAEGNLLPAAKTAIDRGVFLDVGHSGNDFSFKTARSGLAQGILPDTISTDLNCFNIDIIGSLALTMTKFMALGLSLTQVIERVTINPAKALRKTDEIGSLKPGLTADFTLAEQVDETAQLQDGNGGTLSVSQILKVRGVCRAGKFSWIDQMPFDEEMEPEAVLANSQ